MIITLSRPANYRDSQIDSIDMDLDSLTGNDLILAEENMKRSHPDAALWGTYHTAYIAAKAAHIPAEVILSLSAKDFMAVISNVLTFFGSTGSQESQQEITEG